jgi:hypothetical protein
MIISHKHKFIFIKTKKTAGTSIELGLRHLCGPKDVITPVRREDERLNNGLTPQNWCVSGRRDLVRPWLKKILPMPSDHKDFSAHTPAVHARRLIGEEIWNSYFKFTIERNPWDRQVSHYCYYVRPETGRKMSFDEFMRTKRAYLNNFEIYTIDGSIAADFVMRFENLASDLAAVLKRIGVGWPIELPRAKHGIRKVQSHYREFYARETRDLVANWYSSEIDLFGYEY